MIKPEFKCSNGWLVRFKKRHGVTSKTIVCEGETVSKDTVDTWRRHRLAEILEKYMEKDIYNLNEAASFYKTLPKRTYTTAGGFLSGGKPSKERVNVCLKRVLRVTSSPC